MYEGMKVVTGDKKDGHEKENNEKEKEGKEWALGKWKSRKGRQKADIGGKGERRIVRGEENGGRKQRKSHREKREGKE